jgi:hypothetical protein
MMSQTTSIFKILSVVFFVFIIGGVGWWLGYSQALDFAKAQLTGYEIIPLPPDLKTLSGTVKRIDSSVVYVSSSSVNPLEKDGKNTVAVAVSDSTTIEKLVPKDEEVFDAEMAVFTEAMQIPGNYAVPPEPFVRQAIGISDLASGVPVTVTAAENVIGSPRITATAISINAAPPSALP